MLSKTIFAALIALMVIAAIPYGTVEPWWKAALACAVFAVVVLAVIESLVSGPFRLAGASILAPMLALSALAFVQTLPIGGNNEVAGVRVWNAISADPFQSRFFALQMLALTAFLALLYRYASTERRVRILIYTVLAIAVASAVFGILRQATQQQTGFLLPLLKQNEGFAQFVNKNHFAYLMEMAFGLGLGVILAGGVTRDRLLIWVALLLPIWMGLVLSNSRGGVLAMLTQIVLAALLLTRAAKTVALRAALVGVLIVGVLVGTFWVGGDRLVSKFEAAETSTTRDGVSRNEIWRASFKMFAANPILGVGLGGYWIGITSYHDASGLMTPQEAHNDYLELLASSGLIGLAIGIWFVVVLIRLVRKNFSEATGYMRAARLGAVLGIAGIATHSLVDFGLHVLVNALVFITLIMIATSTSADKIVDLNEQQQ
jgi:O-antigen ligase